MAKEMNAGGTPDTTSTLDVSAQCLTAETPTLQDQIADLLQRPCRCSACEPMYEQRMQRFDPVFADIPTNSALEAIERDMERNRHALEEWADTRRHLPRVMDLPDDIDLADLRGRLFRAGFHLGCPQFRDVVALLADGSFASAVVLSRIGHFDRAQAVRVAPRRRPKKSVEVRRVKPVCSLFTAESLIIPQEEIEADRMYRKRMAEPDHVAKAQADEERRMGEQIAAVMLGRDLPTAGPSRQSNR